MTPITILLAEDHAIVIHGTAGLTRYAIVTGVIENSVQSTTLQLSCFTF